MEPMEMLLNFLVATISSIVSGVVLTKLNAADNFFILFPYFIIMFIIFILEGIIINYFYTKIKCKKCNQKKEKEFSQKMETKCQECDKKVEVIDVARASIEGPGGTEKILGECEKHFYFMGISAQKWIKDADNFDSTMRKISAKHGSVRFLMLNPSSEEARRMSITGNSDLIQNIKNNITTLREYRKSGLNVEVRVYSRMPVFRIAIVDDDKKVYAGNYKVYNNGVVDVNVEQLILDDNGNGKVEKILKEQYLEYFQAEWDDSRNITIDLNGTIDDSYWNEFESHRMVNRKSIWKR